MPQTDTRLDDFIEQFNSGEFFDAHETLESLWIETESGDKDFYKGLIQCAVAFVHLERGNFKGARKLFRTASAYLEPCIPEHLGIQVEQLLEDMDAFFTGYVPAAERRGESMELADYDTPKIHRT